MRASPSAIWPATRVTCSSSIFSASAERGPESSASIQAQALGGPRLLGGQLLGGGVEAGGDGHVLALGGLDAGHGVAHGMLDAGDGQARAGLRGLDAVGQAVQRERDPPQLVWSRHSTIGDSACTTSAARPRPGTGAR